MGYSWSESNSGNVRLKVLMVDNKGTDIFEIFFTYQHEEMSGSYTVPVPEVFGESIGTKTETITHYFFVMTRKNGVLTKENLAQWYQTKQYEYQMGDDLNVVPVLVDDTGELGDSIDYVSNQITGDWMVHTYRLLDNDVPKRRMRVTNLATGVVLNFTEEDLDITDMSPLGSSDPRWKLLTAIGVSLKSEAGGTNGNT